jgi:hypothetical protein
MLVLDALFDPFRQISSNVEIIGTLVRCSPISASERPSWVIRVILVVGRLLPVFAYKKTSQAPVVTSQRCRFCCKSRLRPIDVHRHSAWGNRLDLPALTLVTQLQRYAAHRAVVGGGRATSETSRRRF